MTAQIDSISPFDFAQELLEKSWEAHTSEHKIRDDLGAVILGDVQNRLSAVDRAVRERADLSVTALREHFETRINDLEKFDDVRFDAIGARILAQTISHSHEHGLTELAVEKAYDAIRDRLEGLNEARARANDERGQFATRSQLEDKLEAVNGRLGLLEKQLATTSGHSSGIALSWSILIAVSTVAVGAGVLLHSLIR